MVPVVEVDIVPQTKTVDLAKFVVFVIAVCLCIKFGYWFTIYRCKP